MMVRWCFFLVCALCMQSVTSRSAEKRATQCYGDLGCFHSYSGIPLPQSPSHIATHFRLHVRGTSTVYSISALNFKSHMSNWNTVFDGSKKTKVITHGFLDNGSKAWVSSMTAELLTKGDFNVIVTDWGVGSLTDYNHAAANTFVVGAEIAQLLTFLNSNNNLQYTDTHLIGHSLGAQISGHAGHRVPGIARITGLDPADPGFSGMPTDKRLDASDATFVDVIHTDGSRFALVAGYGTHDAVGDVDFYPNGGEHQPGCTEHPLAGEIGSVSTGHLSGIGDSVTCSHSRSRDLFTESINSNCKFYGHLCPSGDSFEAGSCLGCPAEGCPVMGYDADNSASLKGAFYLSTSGSSPYCGHEYFVDVKISDFQRHTYGEFIITLVGTNGKSEPLKFESLMHAINHGLDEKHVITTHNDIGTVTSVQLQFVKARDLHGLLSARFVKVHSVVVEPAETAQKTLFCAHDRQFYSGHPHTVADHTGCTM